MDGSFRKKYHFVAPSCKLRLAEFTDGLKFQDRAECGNNLLLVEIMLYIPKHAIFWIVNSHLSNMSLFSRSLPGKRSLFSRSLLENRSFFQEVVRMANSLTEPSTIILSIALSKACAQFSQWSFIYWDSTSELMDSAGSKGNIPEGDNKCYVIYIQIHNM